MKERPTSVTVFAIINLILSGLGVIGILFWVLAKLGLKFQSSQGNPVLELMEASRGYQLFTDVASGLGILVTILLLSASIGMFSLKPWSRRVTIGWGVYSILMTLVALGVNYLAIFGPLIANSTGPEHVGMIVAVVIQGVISVFFIGYYLLMIFMLMRPKVVDAFTPVPEDELMGGWDSETPSGGESL